MKCLPRPLAIIVVISLSIFCAADSLDFVNALGIPPTGSGLTPYFFNSSSVSVGGVSVTAWSFTNGWQKSELTGRNDICAGVSLQDHGLGVCTARFGTACGQPGNGDPGLPDYLGELDNLRNYELLQISMTDGSKGNWKGIDLSSLDQNGLSGQQIPPDSYSWGQVFYSDNGLTAGVTDLPTAFATLLCNFSYDTTKPFPTLPYGCAQHPTPDPSGKYDATVLFMNGTTLGAVNSKYLYIMAKNVDQGDPPFSGPPYNDFLLRGVVFDETVPEPGSLLLLASGLGALSVVVKRKLRG